MALKRMVILGKEISPGKTEELNLDVAKLHTNTPIQVPGIVSRGMEDGHVLLLLAGMHGDEINGMEIVRRVIRKGWNKPTKGTVICIPVFNIFGFLNMSRELPDGRDLNRCFPGTKNGSLASRFAFHFMKEIAPITDYIVDFHTGSAQRSNFPQIRCVFRDEESIQLAKVFHPPFIIHSSHIAKTIRESMQRRGKHILLFEGGKTNSIDERVVHEGIEGIKRLMQFLDLRNFKLEKQANEPVMIKATKWVRASHSGMFLPTIENGTEIEVGTILGVITDPFGKIEHKVKSPLKGYVFCVNEAPIVNKGDALFNLGSVHEHKKEGIVHGQVID